MDGALLEARADAWFHALSDSTRRDILRRVLAGEHSVTALAEKYEMTFAAVQRHVAVLERAGLVTKRRLGREAMTRGNVAAVRSVSVLLDELESLWRGRVERIDEFLASPTPPIPQENLHTTTQERPPCPSLTSPTTSTP